LDLDVQHVPAQIAARKGQVKSLGHLEPKNPKDYRQSGRATGQPQPVRLVEHATKTARYEAQVQGRKEVAFDDIKRAIATSVMPSDAALRKALSIKFASRLPCTPA